MFPLEPLRKTIVELGLLPAGLDGLVTHVVSVEEVRLFKPCGEAHGSSRPPL